MKIGQFDVNSFLSWNVITEMKINCCDESLIIWWKFLTLWHFVTIGEIRKSDKIQL